MKKVIITLNFLVLFLIQSSLSAAVIYVNVDANGNNNGTSWNDAYVLLQEAINSAVSGDELWVVQGVYHPSEDANGDSNPSDVRTKRFSVTKDIKLYGGFMGTETSIEDRNTDLPATILSADLGQDDLNTDGNNITESYTEIIGTNAYRIMAVSSTGENVVIDGFVFTGGFLTGSGHAAGLLVISSNATTKAAIKNCKFYGNHAFRGGAFQIEGVPPYSAEANFDNCYFSGNHCLERASAIYLSGWQGNTYLTIDNCVFEENTGWHGAFYSHGGGNVVGSLIQNSVFRKNISDDRGGAIFIFSSGNHEIINCTFVENEAQTGGGAIRMESPTTTAIKNCIFYDNTNVNMDGANFSGSVNGITASYTSISDADCPAGMNCGAGMIYDEDPLFVNLAANDLHLEASSPCVDAGTNTGAPDTDLDGNPRPLPGTDVDLGAYEYTPPVSTDKIVLENVTISTWPNPTTEKLFISLNSVESMNLQLTLVNAAGQQLLQKKCSNNDAVQSLNLQRIPAGAYWLSVKRGEENLGFIKVIKM